LSGCIIWSDGDIKIVSLNDNSCFSVRYLTAKAMAGAVFLPTGSVIM